MEITTRKPFGQVVNDALKAQGRSKKWLYNQLEMTAPTFDARVKNNDWRLGEIIKITALLGLNG